MSDLKKFTPWISFGMNEQSDFVCYITCLPDKPEAGGAIAGMIAEHIIECYANQLDKPAEEVAPEVWGALMRCSLEDKQTTYMKMPVQGDES